MLSDMDRARAVSILVTLLMGGLIIWLIVYTNKLERKKNREIAYREMLFNLLAANIDDVFFISNGRGSFEYVSPNSKRIIGFSSEELCQDNDKFYALLTPELNEWLRTVFSDSALRGPVERAAELAGSRRQFKVRVYPVYQNGALERQIMVLTDQTDTLMYQQTLSDALEAARGAQCRQKQFSFAHVP